MASTAPAAVVAPRSPALERRLRQRRAEARIRLRILADSSLLSGHHASQVPRVAAAAARTSELAAVLADAASLRAELGDVRIQLATVLAEVAKLRGYLAPLPAPPPRPAEDHSGRHQPELGAVGPGLLQPERTEPSSGPAAATLPCTACSGKGRSMFGPCGKCSGSGLAPPAASEAPPPSAAASATGAEPSELLQPALGAAGPDSGPTGTQREHAGGVPASTSAVLGRVPADSADIDMRWTPARPSSASGNEQRR